jgi:DNA-binding response OmpR family regulator
MANEQVSHEALDRPQSNPSPAVKLAGGEQGVILVIDDDMDVLNSIRRLLIREGWVVLTASEPGEGLRSYEAHWQGIALVLLDYYMPDLRGDQVWERMKRINPQVRVLLMTASDDCIPPRMRDGGLSGFVQKPATRKELLRRIREALNHHDPPGPAADTPSA